MVGGEFRETAVPGQFEGNVPEESKKLKKRVGVLLELRRGAEATDGLRGYGKWVDNRSFPFETVAKPSSGLANISAPSPG